MKRVAVPDHLRNANSFLMMFKTDNVHILTFLRREVSRDISQLMRNAGSYLTLTETLNPFPFPVGVEDERHEY